MDRRFQLVLFVAALVALGGCSEPDGAAVPSGGPVPPPLRIVSLAPSLTEMLFALGAGERVVGVTRYCAFPPEVRDIAEVGGHLDPNFEAIVVLDPDLVVLIPSGEANGARLEQLGIPVLEIDQHDVGSLLDSVSILAATCGVVENGRRLRSEMEWRLEEIAAQVAGLSRPRTVVVVGHDIGGGTVRSVWAAGPDTFYDDVLDSAGGVNAIDSGLVRYPELSREGLAALDPDVVLDVVAGVDERGAEFGQILAAWEGLRELRAVREGRVHVLEGNVMVVPGPRLPEMVGRVARALHPKLAWERP